MESKVTELETNLKKQLESLADQIRSSETNLLVLKEGYLKVQGALEVINILQQKKETNEAEALTLLN